jgi:hypothetical protein
VDICGASVDCVARCRNEGVLMLSSCDASLQRSWWANRSRSFESGHQNLVKKHFRGRAADVVHRVARDECAMIAAIGEARIHTIISMLYLRRALKLRVLSASIFEDFCQIL